MSRHALCARGQRKLGHTDGSTYVTDEEASNSTDSAVICSIEIIFDSLIDKSDNFSPVLKIGQRRSFLL